MMQIDGLRYRRRAIATRRRAVRIKRSHKQDKLARVYDDEILPIWTERFGRMLLREVETRGRARIAGGKAMALDAACGTGWATLELLRRLGDTRVVALEPMSALLDVARKKAGALAGKRAFFRSEGLEPRLSFADEVYDLVVANVILHEVDDPRQGLRDLARVAKVGALVAATLPLRGTWDEFFDLFREVLLKHDKHEALERLEGHVAELPDAEEAARWMEEAGLGEAQVAVEEFTLLFRSSREFFFAPVVEMGPLPAWKEIAGKGQEMQDIFWHTKEAIDAYFRDRAFAVTVKAGCLSGVRLERAAAAAFAGDVPLQRPPAGTGTDLVVEGATVESPPVDAIEVSEVDVLGSAEADEPPRDAFDTLEDEGPTSPIDGDGGGNPGGGR